VQRNAHHHLVRLAGAGVLATTAVGLAVTSGVVPVAAGTVERTFTADPSVLTVGDVATLTAAGCLDPLVEPADLVVTISIGLDRVANTVASIQPDADGTAAYVTPPVVVDSMGGRYPFGAACVDTSGAEPEVLFEYEPLTITLVGTGPGGAPDGEHPPVAPAFTG